MLSGGGGATRSRAAPRTTSCSGGGGDDTINARDGVRDMVDCGPGDDLARVDRLDVVSGCEQVNRR